MRNFCSVAFSCYLKTAIAYEEIQIRAAVSLHHVIEIEFVITTIGRWRWRSPSCSPLLQLSVSYVQVQPSCWHVEFNLISVLDQRQHPSRRRFGRNMQYHRAVRGTAHPRIRETHHVSDTTLQQLWRQRHVAHFSHSRITTGPAIL